MNLSDLLKHTRKDLNLTQQQFADILNITRGTLSHLERGRTPSADTAKQISNYYKKPLSELLSDKVNKLEHLETTSLLIDNLMDKGEITENNISDRAWTSIKDTLEIEIKLKLRLKHKE